MNSLVLPLFLGIQKRDRLRKYASIFVLTAGFLNLEPREHFPAFDISFMNSFQLCVTLSKWESLFGGHVQALFSWQIKQLVGFYALHFLVLCFHVPQGFWYMGLAMCACVCEWFSIFFCGWNTLRNIELWCCFDIEVNGIVFPRTKGRRTGTNWWFGLHHP